MEHQDLRIDFWAAPAELPALTTSADLAAQMPLTPASPNVLTDVALNVLAYNMKRVIVILRVGKLRQPCIRKCIAPIQAFIDRELHVVADDAGILAARRHRARRDPPTISALWSIGRLDITYCGLRMRYIVAAKPSSAGAARWS
jgi:hypothetical protein